MPVSDMEQKKSRVREIDFGAKVPTPTDGERRIISVRKVLIRF